MGQTLLLMNSIKNLAGYVLNKYQGQITPMKLQKLLYYVKVWTLVAEHKVVKPQDAFYAWKYGPVNPSVYHQYKHYKNTEITDTPPYQQLSNADKQHVDFILESYSFYSAISLSKTTHAEDPWILNKDTGSKIKDQQILDYYSKEQFAKNFPLGVHSEYYPPNTVSHHAFIFDMDENDSATQPTFNSIDEYKSQLEESKNKAQRYIQSL